MPDVDFLVAGGGLAGACAARRLSKHGSVLVVERRRESSGGSGAAAGLVNPILGLRARPVWRIEEAVVALDETVALANAEDGYRRGPTLRPARDAEQIESFRHAAGASPRHCTWLGDAGVNWLCAPHGVLRIEMGGAIDIDGFVERLLAHVDVRHASLDGWMEGTGEVIAKIRPIESANAGKRPPHETAALPAARIEHVTARRLFLCLGRGYTAFPALMRLRLHQVKGQTIRMTRPDALPAAAPHLAGRGYVAVEGETVVCGSTYEHRFAALEPSHGATRAILKKIEQMLPAIRSARLLEERAGVRVTVPGVRLPMVGPLPGSDRVWIFTGLGAKGLLTGPLVAKELPAYIEDVGRIPREIRVRTLA